MSSCCPHTLMFSILCHPLAGVFRLLLVTTHSLRGAVKIGRQLLALKPISSSSPTQQAAGAARRISSSNEAVPEQQPHQRQQHQQHKSNRAGALSVDLKAVGWLYTCYAAMLLLLLCFIAAAICFPLLLSIQGPSMDAPFAAPGPFVHSSYSAASSLPPPLPPRPPPCPLTMPCAPCFPCHQNPTHELLMQQSQEIYERDWELMQKVH